MKRTWSFALACAMGCLPVVGCASAGGQDDAASTDDAQESELTRSDFGNAKVRTDIHCRLDPELRDNHTCNVITTIDGLSPSGLRKLQYAWHAESKTVSGRLLDAKMEATGRREGIFTISTALRSTDADVVGSHFITRLLGQSGTPLLTLRTSVDAIVTASAPFTGSDPSKTLRAGRWRGWKIGRGMRFLYERDSYVTKVQHIIAGGEGSAVEYEWEDVTCAPFAPGWEIVRRRWVEIPDTTFFNATALSYGPSSYFIAEKDCDKASMTLLTPELEAKAVSLTGLETCDNDRLPNETACNPATPNNLYVCQSPGSTSQWRTVACPAGTTCQGTTCRPSPI